MLPPKEGTKKLGHIDVFDKGIKIRQKRVDMTPMYFC